MRMKNENDNDNKNNENENVNDNLSSIDIEGIRRKDSILYFFNKDILNAKHTNKSTSSNFYPYSIHKQNHFK